MSPEELSSLVKDKGRALGFALIGISGPASRKTTEFHEWWVDQGFGAGMHFLRRQRERRKSIEEILPGARSAVVVALRFPGGNDTPPRDHEERAYGKIARYALHDDYHGRMLPLLEELARYIDAEAGVDRSLAYVDTGAISERALAASAGIGWVGKNAMLIHPEEGSWFWLGEIITRAELKPDSPLADRCGNCRRCLDACPTGAIYEGIRAIDARKCLGYLNIEHRGPIPQEFHAPMGDWLLGCDICQEVCPWNAQAARKGRKDVGPPPLEFVAVDEILALTPEEFRTRYKHRAVSRAKYDGLQRNAEIVKENFRAREPR